MNMKVLKADSGYERAHGSLICASKKSANSVALVGRGWSNVAFIQCAIWIQVRTCFLKVNGPLSFAILMGSATGSPAS